MIAATSEGVARPTNTGLSARVTTVTVAGRSTRLSSEGSTTTTLPAAGVVVKVALPLGPRWNVNQDPTPRSTSPITVSTASPARLATIDTVRFLT